MFEELIFEELIFIEALRMADDQLAAIVCRATIIPLLESDQGYAVGGQVVR
jgi:hypothetical protein